MPTKFDLNFKVKQGSEPGIILCIPGNSSSSGYFECLFQHEHINHSVVAPDLPGTGDSYHSKAPSYYSILRLRETVTQFANELNEDILLVGASLGGHLALEIAPDIQRLKGLVIFGAPPLKKPANMQEAFLPFDEMNYFFEEEVPKEKARALFAKASHNPKAVDRLMDDFYNTDPKTRSRLMEDVTSDLLLDELEIFNTLKCKKYIIEMEHDIISNNHYIQSATVGAKILKMTECGHFPALEKPEEFSELIQGIASETLGG